MALRSVKRPPKEGKKPFDRATAIAVVALIVSISQWILPPISGWYFSPRLIISKKYQGDTDAMFFIFNAGGGTARNIEVLFTSPDFVDYDVTPDVGATFTLTPPIYLRLSYPHIDAGQLLFVHIGHKSLDLYRALKLDVAGPSIYLFRSEDGAGVVDASPPPPLPPPPP
ncbi:hypothetical protein NKH52_06410 [Mesorhizobium sp. M1066]|uniref:hypothetical protein n=1 Tax=unclassified Mesorhizobium TaxID=325217 RepID=UPI003339856B